MSPPEATWCGSCYLLLPGVPVAPTPAAPAPVAPVVAPGVAPSPPSAWSPPPPPPPVAWPAAPPAYSGWPAPAQPVSAWTPPPSPAIQRGADGRLLSGRALLIVSISVGLGGLLQIVAYLISRDSSISQDTLIRTDLALTLLLYAVVAALIVSQITPTVRLRWGEGALAGRMANGAVLGLGLAAGLLAIVSAAAGHLDPDPRIVLLMSGGDPTHVVVMVLLTVAVAPLVEETLFRGLLVEALRPYGTATAVLVSALFFAAWHFNFSAVLYYTTLGAALAGLYLKRGLASSMTAHACFNGVLTIAAIFVVLGPSHTYDVDGLRLTAPSGWTSQSQAGSGTLGSLNLQGPDASVVSVDPLFTSVPFDPDQAVERLQTSDGQLPSNAVIDRSSVREIQLPTAGTAVEADLSIGANRGELLLFAADGHDYVLLFVNGGSNKAETDFTSMLSSLRPG